MLMMYSHPKECFNSGDDGPWACRIDEPAQFYAQLIMTAVSEEYVEGTVGGACLPCR